MTPGTMTPSTLITLGLAVSAVFIFWTMSSTSSSPFTNAFPRLYNKRVCLLIAHPDDEAMFFAPTVLALTKPGYGNHVKILCLSSGMYLPTHWIDIEGTNADLCCPGDAGDADGLGHIRKKELVKSAMQLGLRNESDVYVVDDPSRFPDSMTAQWSESDVASVLASAFAPEISDNSTSRKKTNKASPPTASIDVLLTFDKGGISNHPNHRSLYHGALYFIRSLMKDKTGYTCPITLYTLTTTNLVRKYAGILDAPLTMVQGAWSSLRRRSSKGQMPSRLLFVSSINEWLTAQSAMVKAHQSQMVWFRWGWITIGRYMAVNDLQAEKI
ncbi:putative N-acetylglucosaminyl-phosphatidylinositol deacetylase [Aspergillus heteromorphus CBS 117.55]|uniref:N-acetylglucosaminylphosphatidylinositol deacetylase n=1 Tax=Aspergillus heteromorphus CBS 117.55 TaxID=1448321 RepID=A0A317V2C5_9EURO|nr:putative N-acetylglucosaminyl-phosphatidylinositol deacetylase [Aspergillus heteromorphus CBS 117.55]PWY67178.1 putative N-acetylglucosaminyl-phosphatidylinositol deacetylase [Aspergillus heteromorphus CBS 117.55]